MRLEELTMQNVNQHYDLDIASHESIIHSYNVLKSKIKIFEAHKKVYEDKLKELGLI